MACESFERVYTEVTIEKYDIARVDVSEDIRKHTGSNHSTRRKG